MKKTFAGILVLLLALCSWIPGNAAQDKASAPGKGPKADILKLLDLDGSRASLEKLYPALVAQVTSEFTKQAREAVREEMTVDSLLESIVPIYAKYYSPEDIQGMIKFYQTPLGRKVASVQPAIAEEMQGAIQKWVMDAMNRVKAKIASKNKKAGNL